MIYLTALLTGIWFALMYTSVSRMDRYENNQLWRQTEQREKLRAFRWNNTPYDIRD